MAGSLYLKSITVCGQFYCVDVRASIMHTVRGISSKMVLNVGWKDPVLGSQILSENERILGKVPPYKCANFSVLKKPPVTRQTGSPKSESRNDFMSFSGVRK